jgi:hypothetical protein
VLQASFVRVRGRSWGSGPQKDRSRRWKGPQDRKLVGLRSSAEDRPLVLITAPPSQLVCRADVETMISGRECDCAVRDEAPRGARSRHVSVACFFPHAINKGHLDRPLGTGFKEKTSGGRRQNLIESYGAAQRTAANGWLRPDGRA